MNIILRLRVKHGTPQYLQQQQLQYITVDSLPQVFVKTERPNPDGHFSFKSILFVICV